MAEHIDEFDSEREGRPTWAWWQAPASVEESVPSRFRVIMLGTTALLLVVVAVLGGVFVGQRSDLNKTRRQLREARETIAQYEPAAGKPALSAAVRPNLLEVATKHFRRTSVTPEGNANVVTIVMRDSDSPSAEVGLKEFLQELGFTDAALVRMGQTRALDGTQRAEGKNVNATWTYHPDHGLRAVFEVEP